MTWLTKLRTYLGHDEPLAVPPSGESAEEARQAYDDAKRALGAAKQRREEVREVTSSLATLRQRNHFGESIEIAMMQKRRPT